MGRKKKEKKQEGGALWLVTFSDLVTLLLTFFVLLLSMSSMDKSVLTKVNVFIRDIGHVSKRAAGRIPQRILFVMDLLENPLDVVNKPERIKDLLFPDDVLPPDINRSTLNENLQVLMRPDGVALVMTDKLLFAPGTSELSDSARVLLEQIYTVLLYLDIDVNISGHTDTTIGFDQDNLELSSKRAIAVLSFFLHNEMRPERFSISSYGGFWPMADNGTEDGRRQNRRVEILLKTQEFIGGYP